MLYTGLGILFSRNGKFKSALDAISNQATRAIFGMNKMYNFSILDVESKLKLFESIVMPILLYGSEIWGFDNTCNVEKIQIRYYKNILGLHKNTSNVAVYGELGTYPISVRCKERILKYWLKTIIMKDGLNYKIYQQQKLDILNRNSINWASKVKCLFYALGMNFVWDQQDTVDMSILFQYIKN